MVYAASQIGTLALLAKLASPTSVGRYALGLAIVTPVLLFAKLQLRSVLATDVYRDHRFSDYLGIRLLTTAIGCGGVLLVSKAANFEHEAGVMIGVVTAAKGIGSLAVPGILLALGAGATWSLLAVAAWQAGVLVAFELPSARGILRREHETGWPTCDPKRF